jgi:hypothetical protein
MQADNKELFKLTSQRTGEAYDLYKDVGNFVFHALYGHMRRPKSIILKLRGVGSWHLRRKRMKIVVDFYPPDFTKNVETDFPSELQLFKYENRVELYHLFLERLKEYEQYVKERDEVRSVRYKTQYIIEKPKDES